MGELEKLAARIEEAIRARFEPMDVHAGKVSVWIKLVRLNRVEGTQVEETVGNVHKITFLITCLQDLVRELSDNLVLAVYGGDVQVVQSMPNLIVKLFDHKQVVAIPGAPPLDQPGQIYLKATVYKWEPSLLDQLFGKKEDA